MTGIKAQAMHQLTIQQATELAALRAENERLKAENKKLRGAIERTAVVVERIYGNAKLADMIRASATQEQEKSDG